MSTLLHSDVVPALPTFIDVPELSEYSNEAIISFAYRANSAYLFSQNRIGLREALKPELITRIRKILLADSEEAIKQNLQLHAQNLLLLLKAYSFAVCGYIREPNFMAPSHLWSTDQIEEYILGFVTSDENTHDASKSSAVIDFLGLYIERISEEQ